MKKQPISAAPAHVAVPVEGLDMSRRGAHVRGRRRRRVNAFKTGVIALVVGGVVVGAGYVGWSEFMRESDEPTPGIDSMTPREAIEQLETEPVWNGPGNPTFGVGD